MSELELKWRYSRSLIFLETIEMTKNLWKQGCIFIRNIDYPFQISMIFLDPTLGYLAGYCDSLGSSLTEIHVSSRLHRWPVNSPHKGHWRFDLCLNKRSSKQSWGWWIETPSRYLWRYCNVGRYRFDYFLREEFMGKVIKHVITGTIFIISVIGINFHCASCIESNLFNLYRHSVVGEFSSIYMTHFPQILIIQ